MKYKSMLAIVPFVIAAASCSTANFSKTGTYTAEASSANCEFSIYTTQPESKFKEIGLIEFSGNFMAGMSGGPESISEIKDMASKSVCENGGNGLLVWETNGIGVYKKATVIRTY